MKKVLLTIATAAALLAPATATPATSTGHGYRNPRAPQVMQAGLRTMPRQFPGVRCSWFVPRRSINCTLHKGGRTYVLWLKPYRVGWQSVQTEIVGLGTVKSGRERCPAALRCY